MPIRVLIVDDSQTVRVAMQAALLMHGFDVLLARDGAEGFRRAQHERPDVILLDVVMDRQSAPSGPGASVRGVGGGGFQLVRRLKADKDTKSIPVLMWTAAPHADTERTAKRIGAVAVLVKGGAVEDLIEALRRCAARAEDEADRPGLLGPAGPERT
jgi:CheY-like chemotaxis protein